MTCKDTTYQTPGNEGSCPPALRNRYFRGKMLTVADYQMEQRYLIQRRRLVNRAVLGWGVISGYRVRIDDYREIVVSEGVAFDERGREVVACESIYIRHINDIAFIKSEGKVYTQEELANEPPKTGLYLLSAHYAECPVDGVRVEDGCGGCTGEWNHIRETVVYSLRWQTGDACADRRPVCRDEVLKPIPDPETTDAGDRGTHATLVEWSRERLGKENEPIFNPCWKDDFCREKGLSFDSIAGVPLACVWIDFDNSGHIGATIHDTVAVRRILYPNDALYDLVRGCDLTRVESISWQPWHGLQEHVRRRAFREKFVVPEEPDTNPTDIEEEQSDDDDMLVASPPNPPAKREVVDTEFQIWFSAPVQVSSLTPDVVSMTLTRREDVEQIYKIRRVPVLWLKPEGWIQGDPKNTARSVRLQIGRKFWEGEIRLGAASGFERPNQVEIRIHCDSIIDWAGQAVDGNAIGTRLPSGNGTPGGDFVSRFIVDRKGTYPPDANSPARNTAT